MISIAIGVALMLVGADAIAQQRPALRGVTSVRIANYGAPSQLLQKRDEFQDIVEEMNALRGKSWRRGDTAVECYSTLVFMSGQKRVGEFRVRGSTVVERPVDKGQSPYTLTVEPADLPRISQRLSGIKPAACR